MPRERICAQMMVGIDQVLGVKDTQYDAAMNGKQYDTQLKVWQRSKNSVGLASYE